MKTISFFSYKGGAGRSTLAYNVIPILAKDYFRPTAESPIIVVDTDVDSCGMSYLLGAEEQVTDNNCIQYLLGNPFSTRRCDSISEHPFLKNLIPVGNAYGYPDNDAILLLPAKDNKNISKDGKNNYAEAGGLSFMESMKGFLDVCDEYFDVPAVIFDSSVGNTALANISNEMASIIVCVMRPTIQFVNGTRRYLVDFEEGEKFSGGGKEIVLVPNVIPDKEITIGNAVYPDAAIDKIINTFVNSNVFKNSPNNTYHMDMLDPEEFGIPMVDSFMYVEGQLLNKKNYYGNEELVLGRYRKLARIINEIDSEY
ncbi:MAG: hypothetical protein IKB86_00480 [Clostridia bacterium]|nr:hypothetical protein [Clostridia bacterium]